ncbi:hypothetical protein [uncultured Hymenobacter sp.]|uniref:hypothetical protein n=1 Tax=uncultured Hymenobacter sp. TaxID=170016 RepID=UPI0035CAB2ED
MTFTLLRGCFTTILIAGISLAGHAQSELPTTPSATPTTSSTLLTPALNTGGKYKDYLYKRYSDDKEARAVIHLFARKQTGGVLWLSTGAAFIGFITTQTGTTTDASGTTTVEVTPLGYGMLVGLFGGVGAGKLSRFSNSNLYEALATYEQTRSFSGLIKKKLKDKDYK